MTPLGEPVVPDVNISTAISSAGIAPISPIGGGGRRSSCESSIASKLDAPSPSTMTTCLSVGDEACNVFAIAPWSKPRKTLGTMKSFVAAKSSM